ncbi:MAG: hypothetical protein WAN86_14470 [Hyphomicrobiaceae bacterium]
MLQRYSPIPFSAAARKELAETRLAGPLGQLGQTGERGGGLVVTPDGSRIVAREDDGSIRVWDLSTGKQVAHLGAEADARLLRSNAPTASSARACSCLSP